MSTLEAISKAAIKNLRSNSTAHEIQQQPLIELCREIDRLKARIAILEKEKKRE